MMTIEFCLSENVVHDNISYRCYKNGSGENKKKEETFLSSSLPSV